MHSSGSYLRSVLEKARFLLDEVTVDAKYSDAFIVNQLVYPVMTDVLARLNLNQDNPITVRYEINVLPDVEYYQLPPVAQEVWRVGTMDEDGRILQDWYPRGQMNPRGPNWSIEGNLLAIRPFPQQAETIQVWYIPTGNVLCHLGTGYLQGDEFVIADTPTLGLRDKRPNAYAGATLRILGTTWQERVIKSFDARTRILKVRVPFEYEFEETSSAETGVTHNTFSGSATSSGAFSTSAWSSSEDYPQTVTYEIAPTYNGALWEAIAIGVALKLAIARNIKEPKISLLEKEYRKAIKTIMDNLMNLQMRTGDGLDKNTIDNPLNRQIFG